MPRHRLRSVALALAATLLACTGPTLAEVAVGQAAPDFRLKDLDGNEVALADLQGKVVVLEWANPNCPFWKRHADQRTMVSTSAKHPDVVWLAINSTNPSHGDHMDAAAWKGFLGERGITYRVLADPTGATGQAYGARTTPHMYVIGADGKLAYVGAIDDDPRGNGAKVNYVDQALAEIAAGKPVSTASTRPYGCSVKY